MEKKEKYFLHTGAENLDLSWDRNCYPTLGKIKIKNSHLFVVHWLYRMSLRLMSLNIMMLLHVTVMSSQWWMSATEVTALLNKNVKL